MNFRRHALAWAIAASMGALPASLPRAQESAARAASGAPTLYAVLAEALNGDPQVRVARSNLEITQTRVRQAKSRYWPSAGMSGVAGHSTDREFDTDVQRRTERLEGVLRWNLYNGGNDKHEIAATEREVASAQSEYDRARTEVAERIADAWIEVQRTQAVAAASRRRLHDTATLTNQIVTQGQAGRVSEADVLQAQVALSETQGVHELAVSEAEAARARLETLVGRSLSGIVPVAFPPLAVSDSLVHPAVQAARFRLDAAIARQRLLAEALAPKLDLEVRSRIVDRTDPAPTTAQRRGATVSMNWDVPLGGETFARQDEAQRRVEGARAEVDRLDLGLRADLAALRQRERSATESLGRTLAQVDQSRGLVRAAAVQYEAGRRTVQQLIQTRESQFSAEQRYAEAQARLQQLRMKQWSTAGALLAAVGMDTPANNLTPPAPPVMDPPNAPVSWRTAPAMPAAATVAAASPQSAATAKTAAGGDLAAEDRMAVLAQTEAWRAAWAARNVDAYLGFYAPRFAPARGQTRAQWEAQRRHAVGGQRGVIELMLDQPKVERRGDAVTIEFEQRYRSATYSDKVRKRLAWVRDGGQWKIQAESVD